MKKIFVLMMFTGGLACVMGCDNKATVTMPTATGEPKLVKASKSDEPPEKATAPVPGK